MKSLLYTRRERAEGSKTQDLNVTYIHTTFVKNMGYTNTGEIILLSDMQEISGGDYAVFT